MSTTQKALDEAQSYLFRAEQCPNSPGDFKDNIDSALQKIREAICESGVTLEEYPRLRLLAVLG